MTPGADGRGSITVNPQTSMRAVTTLTIEAHDRPGRREISARWRRRGVLLMVLAAHLLVMLFFVFARRLPEARPVESTLQLLSLKNTAGVPAKPAATRSVTPIPPKPVPAPVTLPAPPPPPIVGIAAGGVAGASVGVDGGCAMSIAIAQAIEATPAAIAALQALPPEVRSSADAVMIWNTGWLRSPTADGSDGLLPVRQVFEQVFAASAPQCTEAQVTGPQFIPVTVGDRTVMLVVGSGSWAWKNLLELESYDAKPRLDASQRTMSENIRRRSN